jgi:ubiquinone/menaquinone biosynthesis C-methylase UbiE
LDYQRSKSSSLKAVPHNTFLRAQQVRQRLSVIRPIEAGDRILEVGSGAHGLVFALGTGLGVGIDPLAAEYRRMFPKIQEGSNTVAAQGEELPFADSTFDIVLSDNVIDHAFDPVQILHEIARVLKPGGRLFFTVNVHHPVYDAASRLHGLWNAAGLKLELSAFADHTVHFTEKQIRAAIRNLPLEVVQQGANVSAIKAEQRRQPIGNLDAMLKKLWFKNAVYEAIAIRK